MNRAIKLAKESDVIVLFLGLDELSEAEGIDRINMKLPINQLELVNKIIELDKRIVVVISSGSVIELPFAKKVNALVHMHLTGQASARAIINILNGDVNPSGKLSIPINSKIIQVFIISIKISILQNIVNRYL